MFFSIVIPVYNRADIICKTLESVSTQNFQEWECIIVDDGSTDNTQEKIKDFIKTDSRFKYIYQNNAERSAARNNGIKNAKGEYICFLDSDDFFLKNHLEVLHKCIELQNNPICMFFTNYFNLKENEIIPINIPIFNNEYGIKYLLENPIIPARTCIHKNILSTELFDEDIVVVEDLILWLKIAHKYKIYHISEPTVLYNIHDDNSVNIKNNGAEKRLNGLKLFFKRYPEVAINISKKEKKQLLSNTYFNIAKHHIFHDRKKKALYFIFKSLFLTPIHPQNKHKLLCIYKLLTGSKIEEYQK